MTMLGSGGTETGTIPPEGQQDPNPPNPTAPAAIAPPPVDMTEGEIVAAAQELDRTLAATWTTREATMREFASQAVAQGTEEGKAQAQAILAKLETERAQWTAIAAVLPVKMQEQARYIANVAKEQGVPVSLLRMAKTDQDVHNIVQAWQKEHPKTTAAPAPVVPVGGKPKDEPTPPQKVDSGVTVGSQHKEEWRGMSALDRIKFGMRGAA